MARYSRFGRHDKVAFQAEERESKAALPPQKRVVPDLNQKYYDDPGLRRVCYLLAKIAQDGLWVKFMEEKATREGLESDSP